MICGKDIVGKHRKEFHVDHIVPISKGGDEWDLDNLQLTCPRCNLSKGDKMVRPKKKKLKQTEPDGDVKLLRWEE